MTLGWYVVQTKVAKEVIASVSIASKGFDVYIPMRTVDIAHAGKRERVERPLFPRYLFVSTEHEGLAHGDINYARGVANKGLLCSYADETATPYTVSNAIINGVRHREEISKVKAGELRSGYQPGDTFMIRLGSFAGIEGTYLGEEKGMVSVLIHLFGRSHKVEVPYEDVPRHKAVDNFAA